jgi:hypothetical protein
MWDPVTETSESMVANPIPRNYHSAALLLPDATVFSGGGLFRSVIVGGWVCYEERYQS